MTETNQSTSLEMQTLELLQGLTVDFVKEFLEYRDGKLYWRKDRRRAKAGTEAGGLHKSGYHLVIIAGKLIMRHHLVYFMHEEKIPADLRHFPIAHLNGDQTDDHFENLRPVRRSEISKMAGERRKDKVETQPEPTPVPEPATEPSPHTRTGTVAEEKPFDIDVATEKLFNCIHKRRTLICN